MLDFITKRREKITFANQKVRAEWDAMKLRRFRSELTPKMDRESYERLCERYNYPSCEIEWLRCCWGFDEN